MGVFPLLSMFNQKPLDSQKEERKPSHKLSHVVFRVVVVSRTNKDNETFFEHPLLITCLYYNTS